MQQVFSTKQKRKKEIAERSPLAEFQAQQIEQSTDWALRISGKTLGDLLFNAAMGMSSILVSDLRQVQRRVHREIEIEAENAETLLVNWLGELAYLAESELLVFRDFEMLQVSANFLQAAARGSHVAGLQKHFRAITCRNLEIVRSQGGLEATIVFEV